MDGNRRYVGIMASESAGSGLPPFGERQFYSRLCATGSRCGLRVYVFSPLSLNRNAATVRGYTFSEAGGWTEETFPLPELIYDRAFFDCREDYQQHRAAVRALQAVKPVPYLGRGLASKWEMLGFLRRDPELLPFLPKTARLGHPEQAAAWLARHRRIFLKPEAGTHGKGTAMVERLDGGGFLAKARSAHNRPLSCVLSGREELICWLRDFTGGRNYLIQQFLELSSREGEAWDIRALVQKNGRGLWELTGTAVRTGASGSITSNIHGGGTARETGPFLLSQFDEAQAAGISRTLLFLSGRIPPALEAMNGRMAELGLDLGVDREGRVWIIEVNTKPGRSVFRRLGRTEEAAKAESNPILYARHLLACSRSREPLIRLPGTGRTEMEDNRKL